MPAHERIIEIIAEDWSDLREVERKKGMILLRRPGVSAEPSTAKQLRNLLEQNAEYGAATAVNDKTTNLFRVTEKRTFPGESEITYLLNRAKPPSDTAVVEGCSLDYVLVRSWSSIPKHPASRLIRLRSPLVCDPDAHCSGRLPEPTAFIGGTRVTAPFLPDVEILVKSFRRFDCLEAFVRSVRHFYPAIPIRIADDSFEESNPDYPDAAIRVQLAPNTTWHQLPFDTGIAASRNFMVNESKADIIVMCDDDFVFTHETNLDGLLNVLRNDKSVDLIGGAVRMDGVNCENWCARLQWQATGNGRKRLISSPLESAWNVMGNIPYRRADTVFNFYAARRSLLQRIPWDNEFKITYEHIDHFLAMKNAGAGIYYTPAVVVSHHRRPSRDYARFRARKHQYQDYFMQKWQLADPPSVQNKPEPQIPSLCGEILRGRMLSDKPNIVLLAVGHSGSTIAAKMLEALGWNLGDADATYAESVSVRQLNVQCLRAGCLDRERARDAIRRLPQPWAIKDPRFAKGTLPEWVDILDLYRPALVWITRDLEKTKASYRRRNEQDRFVESEVRACRSYYEQWPWGKMKVDLSEIAEAVELFDPARA